MQSDCSLGGHGVEYVIADVTPADQSTSPQADDSGHFAVT